MFYIKLSASVGPPFFSPFLLLPGTYNHRHYHIFSFSKFKRISRSKQKPFQMKSNFWCFSRTILYFFLCMPLHASTERLTNEEMHLPYAVTLNDIALCTSLFAIFQCDIQRTVVISRKWALEQEWKIS